MTHDYYQIPFIPLAAIFLALGTAFLIEGKSRFLAPWVGRSFGFVCVILMLGFGWFEARQFYNLQSGVDVAGDAVERLTPPDALILTGDTNDSTLLYNCNRWGWTGGYASYFPNVAEYVEKARLLGADYYVTTKINEIEGTDFGNWLLDTHELIERADQYVLVKLQEPK